MKIANNIPGMVAQNRLTSVERKSAKSAEKLASGLRITRASDDAAGLSITEKMRAQIRGLRQASRNIQDGISLVQVADKGLGDILEPPLHRIRELAIQAANDVLSYEDRMAIQEEIDHLKQNIQGIATSTNFNGIRLLDGSDPRLGEPSPPYDYADVLAGTPVTSNGKFAFKTNLGYPTTSADDNKILVFGNGSTSTPRVLIDGTVYSIQNTPITYTVLPNGYHEHVYQIADTGVTVTQLVGIVDDKYEIRYEVRNNSGEDKNIGIMHNIDTMLGNDDHAPFIVNGETIINQTLWSGGSIPGSFIVYNQQTGEGANAELQAHGIIRGAGIIEAPSHFGIGFYANVRNYSFRSPEDPDLEPVPEPVPGPVGDSGYSLWWDSRQVGAGSQFTVNTFYGLSVPPTIEDPTVPEEGPFSVVLQVGPNAGNQFDVELSDVRIGSIGIASVSVLSHYLANQTIGIIDRAIQVVSRERSKFGSYQNALEHIGNNVAVSAENLQAAESRIRDLDMTDEIMAFTKNSILQQAATAMLAHANMAPQGILQLLG